MAAPGEGHPLRPVPRHRYVDFRMAGEGAMGLAYLAHDTELKRNVAFKIVRPETDTASSETPATPLEASVSARDARFAEVFLVPVELACRGAPGVDGHELAGVDPFARAVAEGVVAAAG